MTTWDWGKQVSPATGPLDESYVFSGLVSRGMPAHVAEGIVMNLRDESGLNPGINEQNPVVPGSRGGYGLAQWTGPRRKALEAAAGQRGVSVDDPEFQLDFLVSELQGPEKRAWESLSQTSTPGDAAAAFAKNFLRPAKEHLDRRVASYTGGTSNAFRLSAPSFVSEPDKPDLSRLLAEAQEEDNPDYGLSFAGLDPEMFMSRRRFG